MNSSMYAFRLAFSLLLMGLTGGCAPQTEISTGAPKIQSEAISCGLVSLDCDQEDAMIYIDGRFVGLSGALGQTLELAIPKGTHQLRATIPGHPDLVDTLTVEPEQKLSVLATMPTKEDPPDAFNGKVTTGLGQVHRMSFKNGTKPWELGLKGRKGESVLIIISERNYSVGINVRSSTGEVLKLEPVTEKVGLFGFYLHTFQHSGGEVLISVSSPPRKVANHLALWISTTAPPMIKGPKGNRREPPKIH